MKLHWVSRFFKRNYQQTVIIPLPPTTSKKEKIKLSATVITSLRIDDFQILHNSTKLHVKTERKTKGQDMNGD
jgi:hypothetical protein